MVNQVSKEIIPQNDVQSTPEMVFRQCAPIATIRHLRMANGSASILLRVMKKMARCWLATMTRFADGACLGRWPKLHDGDFSLLLNKFYIDEKELSRELASGICYPTKWRIAGGSVHNNPKSLATYCKNR